MEKTTSVLLIFVLLLSLLGINISAVSAADIVTFANGEVFLNDDFELQLDGATQSGYTVVRNGNVSSVRTVDGNAVILTKSSDDATASTMYFDKNFGKTIGGTLILECKVRFGSNAAKATVMGVKNENSVWVNPITFNTDGKIKLYNSEISAYEANEWYHLILLFNTSSSVLEVRLTGKNVNVTQTRTFSYNGIKAARFDFDFSNGGYECLLDDIRIYGGTSPLTVFPQRDYNKNINAIDEATVNAKLKKAAAYAEGTEHGFVFGEKKELSSPCIIDGGEFLIPKSELEASFSKTAVTEKTVNGVAYADGERFAGDNGYGFYYDDRGLAIISPPDITYDFDLAGKLISTVIFARPDGSAVAADITNERPRICINSAQIDNLKSLYSTDSKVKSDIDTAVRSAEGNLSGRPVGYADTDARTVSQRIRTRVGTIGIAYLYTGDDRYAERLWKEAENFCSFEDWFASDSLSHAEMLFAAAMVYDWLYDYLPSDDKATLKNAIIEKGLSVSGKIFDSTAYGYSTLASKSDNIAAVYSSGALTAALAVAEKNETNETVLKSLEFPLKVYEGFLENYAPDGGYYEGFGYSSYALRNFAPAMASLENTCKTDYGLTKAPSLGNAVDFYVYLTGVGGIFNFHDCAEQYRRCGCEMYWFADKYDKPYLGYYANQYASESSASFSYADLFFYKGNYEDNANLIPDKLFKNAEIAVFKGDNSYVGMHAGKVGVAHGEFDAGSFVYDALGERFVSDLGPDSYSLSEYNTVRDNFPYYRRRAEGHNTLVINPDESAGQDTNGKTKFTAFESKVGNASATADLTSAYEKYGAESVVREFEFDRNSQILEITDTVVCEEPSEIYSFIHTKADVSLGADNKSAELTLNGKAVTVELLSPSSATLSVMDAVPLSTSPNPDGQNANSGVKKLYVHLQNVSNAEIKLRLSPKGASVDNTKIRSSWFLKQNSKTLEYEYAPCLSDGKYIINLSVPAEAAENGYMAIIALYKGDRLISANMRRTDSESTEISLPIEAVTDELGEYRIRAFVFSGGSLAPATADLPEPLIKNS